MRVGSLFSGIGGIDLGLERAGMEIAWQVEKDPWCRKVLAKHWPKVPKYDDITTLRTGDLESVDLVCGGFPCQPVSVAGARAGTDDARWLWTEFRRIIDLLRPRYVLVENVPGLLTANGGDAFGEVLGGLAESGYDAEWDCISAADVGAPHRRDRIWIVAHARSAESMADAEGQSKRSGLRACGAEWERGRRSGDGGGEGHAWATEPDVGRVVDGVPRRVDRLRGLGNAVVPQVVEWIGRRIL